MGVIVDAKAGTEGLVLGTEDRKFLEYVKRHSAQTENLGINRVYLCVVSSSFRAIDADNLRTALAGSLVRGFAMWSVASLMATVEQSIYDRSRFTLAALESEFQRSGIPAN